MASVEQVGEASQYSDAEQAATQNAVSEAHNIVSQEYLVLVTGVIRNIQPRGVMLTKKYTWEGRFLAEPSNDAFVHQGTPTQGPLQVIVGSKGFVLYATFDKALPQLGYLVAWSKPANKVNDIDKVYVEAGDHSKLIKMEESEILKKLDASGSTSRYWDRETGAVAAAEVVGHGDKLALIGAAFDRSDA